MAEGGPMGNGEYVTTQLVDPEEAWEFIQKVRQKTAELEALLRNAPALRFAPKQPAPSIEK